MPCLSVIILSEQICGDVSVVSDNGANEDGLISPKRRKTTDSEPNSRSNSVSPKPMSAPKVQEIRRKVVESKLWTRSKRKMAVEAAAAAAKAASFSKFVYVYFNNLIIDLLLDPG